VQVERYVPGSVKVNRKLSPRERGGDAKATGEPVRDAVSCVALSMLAHVTVVPAETVREEGLNAKFWITTPDPTAGDAGRDVMGRDVVCVVAVVPVVAIATGVAGDEVIAGGDVMAGTVVTGDADAAGPEGERQPPDEPARISSAIANTVSTRGYMFGIVPSGFGNRINLQIRPVPEGSDLQGLVKERDRFEGT